MTFDDSRKFNVVWSPDGTQVAYVGWFSPDSRFMAYLSNESGRIAVHVRPFDPSSWTAPDEDNWAGQRGCRL